MNSDEAAEAHEQMVLKALSDPQSAYYKGLVKMLRVCEATDRQAKLSKAYVTIPFPVSDLDVVALEAQFSVSVKVKGTSLRARATPRVAGMFFLLESALLEHAVGGGRSVLLLDGDLMSLAAGRMDGRVVERTRATARLEVGYFFEEECIARFCTTRGSHIEVNADCLVRELRAGGGEHYWPTVREKGPQVDAITVNHFKTPIGAKQLAWLAYMRGSAVYGAFPFQVEMLTQSEGRLACFPGMFYVDRENDTLTLVPSGDATMSISHPYSALMEFVQNNSIVVGGQEFLCEKYNSVRGILYYTLIHVDADVEISEVLRTSYYDTSALGVTVMTFPEVKLSAEGVPIGWKRGTVRMLTSRCEKVMSRVATSGSDVVEPAEVFRALMDYNNTVVSSLDTVSVADRMPVEDESRAALAIALHVNWTRHAARGTFRVLMNAIRFRYEVSESSLFGLAFVALSAWWTKPDIRPVTEVGELPVAEVVDWCGADFSVVMRDVDPWIEIVQEVGRKCERDGKFYPWLPIPRQIGWIGRLLTRVRAEGAFRGSSVVTSGAVVRRKGFGPTGPRTTVTVVDTVAMGVDRALGELTDLKASLARKMHVDQGAQNETLPTRFPLVRGQMITGGDVGIPVVDVDPVSAINDDILMCNGGPFDRNMVATGYRLAECEVDKVTEGSYSINDSKRLIPRPRWVRMPKVDAGVEGKRAPSQASLMGAIYKRNVGVPSNRGSVDLCTVPEMAVERIIQVCYRSDWENILARHLDTGLWEANDVDIQSFVADLDEKKTQRLLSEFFMEGIVDLERWMLMAKGKIKAGREEAADHRVDHSQTIMYLENSSTNAMYSAMLRRFKECVDECLRPEVCLNGQRSDEQQEEWYNSLESHRKSFARTYSYAADIRCFDRSQEHTALRVDLAFYRRHGLNEDRLRIWEATHGPKKAMAMMYGVVISIVLGGISGLWKTLFRNGIVNLAALVVSANLKRRDIVMLDIKGDDLDAEFSRAVDVETVVEHMSLTFNFSAKFFTNDVRYMCKTFRIKLGDKWYFVADPWARTQSLCTPLWIGNVEENLSDRWISLCDALRHYDNGLLVDGVAEAAQQYYGLSRPLYGMARGLAKIKSDRNAYFNFFKAMERVD